MRVIFLILAFTIIHSDALAVFDAKKAKEEKTQYAPTIEERLGLGAKAIIQNSVPEWNDEVVTVVEIFADGSRRLKRENGEKVLVRRKNLERTLSPRSMTGCGDSHGTMICEGQMVFYPTRSTTLGIPEAKVKVVFDNGRTIINDGFDQPISLKEIGVEMECSPQKQSICRNAYVIGDGYSKGRHLEIEGPIEKIYSNGIVVVRASSFWKYPIDVKAVTERVAATDNDIKNYQGVNNGAVIMSSSAAASVKRDPATAVKATVTREVEPNDPGIADSVENSRRAD